MITLAFPNMLIRDANATRDNIDHILNKSFIRDLSHFKNDIENMRNSVVKIYNEEEISFNIENLFERRDVQE